jgi:hypothetical protein
MPSKPASRASFVACARLADDGADLGDAQHARDHIVLLALGCVRRTTGRDQRRRDRQRTVEEIGMRDAPHVPELAEDPPAGAVHAVGDATPTLDVRRCVDARCSEPTARRLRDRRRLRDEQTGIGARAVVRNQELARRAIGRIATAGHRRHHHAIGQGEGSDAERGEENGIGDRLGHGGIGSVARGEQQTRDDRVLMDRSTAIAAVGRDHDDVFSSLARAGSGCHSV